MDYQTNIRGGGIFHRKITQNVKRGLIIIFILLLMIGTTLALWIRVRTQNGKNEVASTCISLEIDRNTEGDAIVLEDAFPILDREGMELDGYTFTLVNGCDSYIAYNINLESLTSVASSDRFDLTYLDAVIDDNGINSINSYESTSTLLNNEAYDTRILDSGFLTGNERRTFTLRVWIDEDAPKTEMDKAWEGKVTVYGELKNFNPVNAVTYLTSIVSNNTDEMYYDGTSDNNLRYMGSNPKNYVKFNNELWRIIGVMNNVTGSSTDDGTGESRVKIIRNENIGRYSYSEACRDSNINWETKACSSYIYNNNWESSDAKKVLGAYYNSTYDSSYNNLVYENFNGSTNWYMERLDVNFVGSGMNVNSKNLVDDATYYLGGYNATSGDQYFYQTMISSKWYEAERTNQAINNYNPLTWTGPFGMMYPSDYGYATSGGSTSNKALCDSYALYTWSQGDRTFCRGNNYLYDGWYQWLMTPRADASGYVASVYPSGLVNGYGDPYNAFGLRPVLYLKSSVKIVGGIGTSLDPYILSA